MKGILDDPEGFFELGGWDFLEPESDAEVGSFLIFKKSGSGFTHRRTWHAGR